MKELSSLVFNAAGASVAEFSNLDASNACTSPRDWKSELLNILMSKNAPSHQLKSLLNVKYHGSVGSIVCSVEMPSLRLSAFTGQPSNTKKAAEASAFASFMTSETVILALQRWTFLASSSQQSASTASQSTTGSLHYSMVLYKPSTNSSILY